MKIRIHSTVDIITNSSSITFSKKGNKYIIAELLSELFNGNKIEVVGKGDKCWCYEDEKCQYCELEDNEYLFDLDQSLYDINYEKFGKLLGAKYVN